MLPFCSYKAYPERYDTPCFEQLVQNKLTRTKRWAALTHNGRTVTELWLRMCRANRYALHTVVSLSVQRRVWEWPLIHGTFCQLLNCSTKWMVKNTDKRWTVGISYLSQNYSLLKSLLWLIKYHIFIIYKPFHQLFNLIVYNL